MTKIKFGICATLLTAIIVSASTDAWAACQTLKNAAKDAGELAGDAAAAGVSAATGGRIKPGDVKSAADKLKEKLNGKQQQTPQQHDSRNEFLPGAIEFIAKKSASGFNFLSNLFGPTPAYASTGLLALDPIAVDDLDMWLDGVQSGNCTTVQVNAIYQCTLRRIGDGLVSSVTARFTTNPDGSVNVLFEDYALVALHLYMAAMGYESAEHVALVESLHAAQPDIFDLRFSRLNPSHPMITAIKQLAE